MFGVTVGGGIVHHGETGVVAGVTGIMVSADRKQNRKWGVGI